MFNWEKYFLDRITKIRESEAICYYKANKATNLLYVVNAMTTALAAVATFGTMSAVGMDLPSVRVLYYTTISNISIFTKNFDFYQKFRFLPKISIFTKNFDFYQKIRF